MKTNHSTSFSGVHATPRYSYWRELLEQWVFLVERSYRVTKGEHPAYAYKERTNVGILAAAAAANGWVALEECRSTKFKPSETEETYEGRSDMRIWRDARHHEVEAKFLRVALKSSSTTRLDKAASKARADASRSIATEDRVDRKIALTCVVPTVSDNQYDTLSQEQIRDYASQILKHIRQSKPHFLAYTFPGPVRAAGTKKRKALGIILFGEEQNGF